MAGIELTFYFQLKTFHAFIARIDQTLNSKIIIKKNLPEIKGIEYAREVPYANGNLIPTLFPHPLIFQM